MDNTSLWKMHFQIQDNDSRSLHEHIQAGTFSEEEYLQWASENYQLPLLDNNFFPSIEKFDLLKKYPSKEWNEGFFPVHEWEETIYIACIEPQEIPIKENSCLVLGPFSAMKSLWKKMAQPKKETTSTLDFSSISSWDKPSAPLEPAVTAQPDTEPENTEASVIIPLSSLQTLTNIPISSLNEKEVTQTQSEITNIVKVGSSSKEVSFTTTKTIMPFPEKSTQFSFIRTVFSEQIILEARGKIQETKDPHQALISAFHILKDYYKKLMWAVRDEKGRVFPIACTSSWDFSEEAWNTPLDFKTPNPFRLAKFTQKPYHGKLFANSANDHFLKLWNGGKYPGIFSVVPVKMQGKVFAYFIGCEPGLHFHPTNSLDIMSASCDELVKTFLAINKDLVKKAAQQSA